jgi:cytochrome c-type biogenesis protein CcmH
MTRAMSTLRLAVALLVILGVTAPAWAAPKKDPARAITDGIICPCSCGEILTGCTCDTGKAMKAYVDREVGDGKSKDQVEAALVSQYGEVILGAPKAQGFNLVVWIAPFVMTAVGFLFASHVLVKWSRRREALAVDGGSSPPGAPGPPGPPGPPDPSDSRTDPAAKLAALRARAEEELKGLRE